MWVEALITRFPYAAALLCAVAVYFPGPLAALEGVILPLLGLLVFAISLTLTTGDLARVARRPLPLLLGLALQYLLMPLLGWALAWLLRLPPQFAAGVVLVGACSGGVAASVMVYLARGDPALALVLAVVSALLAEPLTPLLLRLLLGQEIPLPWGELLLELALVVVVPGALGLGVGARAGGRLDRLRPLIPGVSAAVIVLITGVTMAVQLPRLAYLAPAVVLAVMLHNLLGLLMGYWLPRWLGWDEGACRSLAIATGMQGAGLAVALALAHLSPAAALPAALFGVWHYLSAGGLAAHWARRDRRRG
jgi:BASS family bile acid:Na+ symporter